MLTFIRYIRRAITESVVRIEIEIITMEKMNFTEEINFYLYFTICTHKVNTEHTYTRYTSNIRWNIEN